MFRVEALARRLPLARAASGDLVLDPARHSVVYADTGVLPTPTEFRMLAAVTSRPGEVVRRRVVIAAAWPDGAQVHDNTVDSYATRIRRKLAHLGVNTPSPSAAVRNGPRSPGGPEAEVPAKLSSL